MKHQEDRFGSSSVTRENHVSAKIEWAAIAILLGITALNLGFWNALFVFLGTATVLGILYMFSKLRRDKNAPPEV